MNSSISAVGRVRAGAIILICLAIMADFAQADDPVRLDVQALVAGPLAEGTSLRLEGLSRIAGGETWLTLEPQPIFASGAKLVVVGADGSEQLDPPAVRHYHGHERDDRSSVAFVSVHPDGRVRGWVRQGERIEALHREPGSQRTTLALQPVSLGGPEAAQRQFSCGADHLPAHGDPSHPDSMPMLPDLLPAIAAARGTDRWVGVAIDSDFEYFQLFNNTSTAAAYSADLIGFASSIYRNEIDTGLLIPYLRLFSTAADPWQQTGSTACMLYEFGQHWHQHQGQVQRSIAHFMSGKNLGGGIAWLGVLCMANQQANIGNGCPGLPATGPYAGGYGLSAGLAGNFNPGNPQVLWDNVVVAHEIGHNFSSPHTHCYGGIGGNPSPVDQCHVESSTTFQCHSGSTTLPGPQGQGSGTIMSYCHLLPGGLTNVSFNFGTGHAFGVQPVRVANRMRAYAQQVAAQQPACFAAPDVIFASGFDCAAGLPGCSGGGLACLSAQGATANGAWFSGDPANRVRNLQVGAGNMLTGIAVDVRVQAVAPSWLHEARVMFSSTDQMAPAVQYTPGLNQQVPGSIDHSSNGVIDFVDAGISNVVVGADGILRVEWFETLDDTQVNPDSIWSNATSPVVCPGIRLVCSNQAACDAAAQAAP